MTKEATPLSLAAFQGLAAYLLDTNKLPQNVDWFIISNLYGGPGSIINSFPPSTSPSSTSSYAHRDSGYVWQFYANTALDIPAPSGSIVGYLKAMVASLGPEAANLPAYAPYADPELGVGDDAHNRYWGAAVPRLKTIQKAFDPKDILYSPQGI